MIDQMLANPMLQQMLGINDPRAEQMKQMMMIMGGLGQQQVPPQPGGQPMTTNPLAGANPMLNSIRGGPMGNQAPMQPGGQPNPQMILRALGGR